MSDLISRKAAIDALCDNCDDVQAVCAHYPCKRYIAIEKLPSAQRWIPVSERLPRYGEDVLLSINGVCSVGVCVQTSNNEALWYYDGWYHLENDVGAWMPLPEPWKGGERCE